LALGFLNITLDPDTAHSWVVDAMPFLVPAIGFLMVSRFKYAHATNALFGERKPSASWCSCCSPVPW